MAALLNMSQARLDYHVDKLSMGNYLEWTDYMGVANYGLGLRGRQYLVETDQLGDDGPPEPPSMR